MSTCPKVPLHEFWKNFDLNSPPYIHPSDQRTELLVEEEFLAGVTDLNSFVRSRYYGDNSTLIHSHLLPSPFAGDLQKGDVFVLMLNPGFSLGDYYGERQPQFRRALQATLNQTLENEEFPFIWLNPKLSFHPGFIWWSKKLRALINRLGDEWGLSHFEASKRLSRRLCGLELFPYHSQSFNPKHVSKGLPSMQVVLEYVKELGRRAQSREVFIVVMRSAKMWSLPECDCVYSFSSGAARGAHLTPDTDMGRKLLEFVRRNPRE